MLKTEGELQNAIVITKTFGLALASRELNIRLKTIYIVVEEAVRISTLVACSTDYCTRSSFDSKPKSLFKIFGIRGMDLRVIVSNFQRT